MAYSFLYKKKIKSCKPKFNAVFITSKTKIETNGKIYVFEVKIIIKLQMIFAKPRTKLETKKANKDLKRFCLKEKIAEL